MAKNTTINLRVNSAVKEQAGKILENMGLTFSDAFNLMLYQVQIKRALPFEIVAYGHMPKPETLARIELIENGNAEMAGPFETFDEYKAWLAADDEVIDSGILTLILSETGTHSDIFE